MVNTMIDLSPAAQAVLDASSDAPVGDGWNADRLAIAAALRAATDQVAPVSTNRKQLEIRFDLLRIATELEAQ